MIAKKFWMGMGAAILLSSGSLRAQESTTSAAATLEPVLITAQRIPPFIRQDIDPLPGLNRQDAQALLVNQGVELACTHFEKLYAQIDGHALMLTLAATLFQNGADPGRLIDQLTAASAIERFILDAVERQLTDDERAVMEGLAILGEEGGGRQVIEHLLTSGSVQQSLRRLSHS